MPSSQAGGRVAWAAGISAVVYLVLTCVLPLEAGPRWWKRSRCRCGCESQPLADSHPMFAAPYGGTWYWVRSPEEEKQAAAALFNRYCIRCHGVDGRGVWDIPGIPDFSNARFHASRSDDQLARAIMQGRGAVMPPFRGALTLDEAWALARYVRGLVPGTEISRPEDREPQKAEPQPALPQANETPAAPPVKSKPPGE